MDKFLQWLAIIGLSLGAFFLRLVVLTKIWGYIAVPLGAPHIGLVAAYGITLIIRLITSKYQEVEKKGVERAFVEITHSVIESLIFWGIAYWIFG